LHPFMPFLSEEIWAKLPKVQWLWGLATTKTGGGQRRVPIENDDISLAVASWPVADQIDFQAETDFALLQETTRAIRNLRQQAEIAPSKKVGVILRADGESAAILAQNSAILESLANLETVTIEAATAPRHENAISQTLSQIEVVLPLEGLIDIEKERAKLQKQLDAAQKDFDKMSAKLQNPAFVERAPAAVLEKDRARVAELGAQIEKLNARLASL